MVCVTVVIFLLPRAILVIRLVLLHLHYLMLVGAESIPQVKHARAVFGVKLAIEPERISIYIFKMGRYQYICWVYGQVILSLFFCRLLAADAVFFIGSPLLPTLKLVA